MILINIFIHLSIYKFHTVVYISTHLNNIFATYFHIFKIFIEKVSVEIPILFLFTNDDSILYYNIFYNY